MKKRILRALTLGLFIGGVGFVSSCKDYDEDLRTENSATISGLEQRVDQAIESKVDSMLRDTTYLQNIIQVMCDCATTRPWSTELDQAIKDLLAKIDAIPVGGDTIIQGGDTIIVNGLSEDEVKKMIEDAITEALKGYYKGDLSDEIKKEVENQLKNLNISCDCDMDALKQQLNDLKDSLAGFVQSQIVSTVTKEYILGLLGDNYGSTANLDDYAKKTDLANFLTSADLANYVTIEQLGNYISKTEFEALKAQVEAMNSCGQACAELQVLVNKLQGQVADAYEILKNHSDSLSTLYAYYQQLETKYTELKNGLEVATNKAQDALDKANAAYNLAQEALTKAGEALTKAQEGIDKANEAMAAAGAAQSTADAAKAAAEANALAIKDLKAFVEKWTPVLEAWETTIPVLQTAVEGLTSRVDALESRVDAVETELTETYALADKAWQQAQSNLTWLTTLQAQVDALNSCNCPDWTDDINQLKEELALKANKEEVELALEAARIEREEIKTLLDNEINTLKESMQAMEESLTGKITDLQAVLEQKIKEGDDAANKRIDELKEELEKTQAKLDEFYAEQEKKHEDIDKQLENLENELKKFLTEDQIKAVVEAYGYLDATGVQELIDLQIHLTEADVKNIIEAYNYLNEGQIKTLIESYGYETVEHFKDSLSAYYTSAQVDAIITDIKSTITTLENKFENYYDKTYINTEILKIYDAIKDVKDELENYYTKSVIDGKVADLVTKIETVEEKLKGYYTKEEIDEKFQEYVKLTEFQTFKDNVYTKVEINNKIDAINTDIDELTKRVEALEEKYDGLNTRVGELESWKGTVDSAINGLQDAVKSIKSDIKSIQDKNDAQDKAISELTSRVDAVEEDVEAIKESLKKLITSIEIQATTNPLFGSIYLPVGIQTNVVALWYGRALNDGTFPSYGDNSAYVFKSQGLDGEKAIAGEPRGGYYEYVGGDVLLDDATGNAGKIYVTVNPSNVDFTGTEFSLVNSKDKESAFKVGALKPSSKLIQFGVTRGAKANGFYEAPVTLNAKDVYDVNIDASSKIQDAVKEVVNNAKSPRSIELSKITSAVKDQLSDIRFDALGLKAWCKEEGRGVYSKYAIAGGTINNPISYASFKDFNYATLPGYERAINLINSTSTRVKNKLKFNIGGKLIDDINAIEIKHIEVPELTDDQKAKFNVSIDTTIVIEGLSYHLDLSQEVEVPVKFEKDLEIPVNMEANVTVPVKIDKEVSVNLDAVEVSSPTVVVTGVASGTGKTTDEEGNVTTILVVPVKDTDGNIVGYTEIPLDEITVNADISAEGGLKDGQTITLNGTPIAKVEIDETYTGTGVVDDVVNYHLVVDETVKTTVDISKDFYFGDPKYKTDASGNYILDENGDRIPERDAEGNIIYTDTKYVHLWVTRNFSDAIEDIWGTVQGSMDDVNEMLDQLKKIQDDANDLLDQINSVEDKIADAIDEVADRLKSYIERINNKIVGVINSANNYLQPLLLVGDANSTKPASRSKRQVTWIKGDAVTFYATNYFAEVIAPAFKRHIAVTNVYRPNGKQASNAAALAKTVNNSGDMNTVIAGRQIRLQAKGFQKGYIYEVAYSALDYKGQQVTHKYYVRVK